MKKFTIDHGLSHDYVHYITQDKTGFLWIATWDGLSRFDGNEFRNYYHQPGEIHTLPFFAIDKVVADSLNNVWVMSQLRPLVRYDRANDRFVREYFNTSEDSMITDIIPGTGNHLWLAAKLAIYRHDPVNRKSKKFWVMTDDNPEAPSPYFNFQIIRDNLNGLWLIENNHSNVVEYKVFKAEFVNDTSIYLHPFSTIPVYGFFSSTLRNPIGNFDIYVSKKGNTWFFCKYGLYKLDPAGRKFESYIGTVDPEEFAGKPYFSWTDDNAGLHLINTVEGKYVNIPTHPGHFVTSVFHDKSGNIWSGEIDEFRENIGLCRYTKPPYYFSHFLTEKDESDKNHLVFPIVEGPDGEIWVGTRYSDDLFRISRDGRIKKQEFIRDFKGEHPRVRSMVRDSAGIWLGCTGNYLVRYDFSDQNFTSVYLERRNETGQTVNLAIHNILSVGNDILINGREGIFIYDTREGNLTLKYRLRFPGSGFCFVSDGSEGFWLGLNGNQIAHLDKNLNETGILKIGNEFNHVEHIVPGDSSDVWVALMGGGLAHFFPETGRNRIYTTADGLANNTVYSLLKDHQGNLWISTNQGISRFNPRTGIFRNFRKEEGLQIREFNSDSWGSAADGRLFFGGVGGMVSFHPDSINRNVEVIQRKPLIITDLFVSGNARCFEKAVYEMDTAILSKGDNNFLIKFACLDFIHPEKIRYRYRLSGLNDQWTETDHRNRVVNYAGLSPGSYHFQLEATNYNGEWISHASLNVIIPHFLHQTLWFRSILVAVAVLAISMFLVLYIRNIRLKAKQREGELRLETLRSQMNPHFIFNSLNSINYFISRNDKFSANQYISDFSRLIRSILSNFSLDYIPLEKEILSLQDYLKMEHLRFGDQFNYVLETGKIGNVNLIRVFPGMVQPFIENAIWHGIRGLEERKGLIRIEFLPGGTGFIQCVIEDDGIGRKMSEATKNELPGKKSQGIGIVMERLKVINNLRKANLKVIIENLHPERLETGTRVVVDIPAKTTE